MTEFNNSGTDFTDNAWDALYNAVDSNEFIDNDAPMIYETLYKRLRFISFGDYLKRYIYRRAGITAPFGEVEETNALLERCFLGELYISNPYECFVLMCLLSEDPLGTYADVWELSYDEA